VHFNCSDCDTRESMLIDELEQNSHKHIIIQSDATLHWEQYDIY
jgi:hypothetical protein